MPLGVSNAKPISPFGGTGSKAVQASPWGGMIGESCPHNTLELMVHPRRRTPTSSCFLSPLFCSILGLPTGLYLDFSCSKEWEVVIDHYRKPSIALRIRPQNILLWILDRRLYIGRHLQATWWASMWRGTSTRQDGP